MKAHALDAIDCDARGTDDVTAHILSWPVPMPGQRLHPMRCPACPPRITAEDAARTAARCDGTL